VGFRRYHAIVLAATVVIVPLALVSVDITSAAEPSRAETWIASSLLYARVRAQKPRLPERFTTSEGALPSSPAVCDTAIPMSDMDGCLHHSARRSLDRYAVI